MNPPPLSDRDPHDILASLLDHYGMSQATYAQMLGVSRSAVNEVVTGRKALSINEWRRWFGAFAFRLKFTLVPSGSSQGFFEGPLDIWDWVQKRAARRRMDTPTRTLDDIQTLAAHIGVLGDYSNLLPDHLAPIFDSGWLYSDGELATSEIALEIQQRINVPHSYDEAVQAVRADATATP